MKGGATCLKAAEGSLRATQRLVGMDSEVESKGIPTGGYAAK